MPIEGRVPAGGQWEKGGGDWRPDVVERGILMVGITDWGIWLPWNRLERRKIFAATGWFNPAGGALAAGEKAVANYDEDSLTMAVAAGLDCRSGGHRTGIGGLYWATTTSPFKERAGAGLIATALNLGPEVRSADFTDSLKSGTTALMAACDAVQAGSSPEILVCASDCRLGNAGSAQEYLFGDGAAAFLIGGENVAAFLEGCYSTSHDFLDHRRLDTDLFDRTWEERWIREEGYEKLIPRAIEGLLKKYRLATGDFARIIFPCPNPRVHAAVAGRAGLTPEQVAPALLGEVGYTGTAHPLLMLAAALEGANPGERIMVVGYGSGCDVLAFRVTEEVRRGQERGAFKRGLSRRRLLNSYEKYAVFRQLLAMDVGIRGEQVAFTSLPVLWRERRDVLALSGSRCRRCGTRQYPSQRVCVNPACGAVDEMDEENFAAREGEIFTYTADHLAFSPDPPAVYGIIDFTGGGRYWFDFTDFEPDELRVGKRVFMSFRRKYTDRMRGFYGYFWKAVPVKE